MTWQEELVIRCVLFVARWAAKLSDNDELHVELVHLDNHIRTLRYGRAKGDVS